MIGYTQRPD